jgi:hypothetical protein
MQRQREDDLLETERDKKRIKTTDIDETNNVGPSYNDVLLFPPDKVGELLFQRTGQQKYAI